MLIFSMLLTLIDMVAQISVLAPFAFLIFYIGFVIHVLRNKKKKIRAKKKILIGGPFALILLIVLAFVINNALVYARYDAWTKKCGHEPVIGEDGLFEPTKNAYTGRAKAIDANKYFCSFEEAEHNGYYPLD